MLAQRLRHKVALQAQATSVDAYGGNVGAWSTEAEVFAAIEPISGTEAVKAGQNVGEQLTRIVIRYRPDVTPQHRIVWGSVVFQILSVACRDEARRWIEMVCKRGGPA